MVNLAVIGVGYVGLSLAKAALGSGMSVVGYDTSRQAVDQLRSGLSRVDTVSSAELQAMIASGFRVECDESVLRTADTIVVCVPTPLTEFGEPDLTMIEQACASIARNVQVDALVVIESTSFPGFTDTVALPILEGTGLRAGVDFSLAFSPERVDPGNSAFGITNTPKVVGGFTRRCGDRCEGFYRRFCEQVYRARGLREAELAKLLENTYRQINIALVNELAALSQHFNVDFRDVIDAASTKPFGFQTFYPGPGVGGHCIPVDPMYLAHAARAHGAIFRLAELAQTINKSMPAFIASRLDAMLRAQRRDIAGAEVLVLGAAYKANVSDARESPAADLVSILRDQGAAVRYHDPYIDDWMVNQLPVPRATNLTYALTIADVVVLLQPHAEYTPSALAGAALLYDACGAVPELATETLGVASGLATARLNAGLSDCAQVKP